LCEVLRRCDHVRTAAVTLYADGDDWRMFEQEQKIGNPFGTTLLDQRPLKRQGVRIRDHAKPSDFNGTHYS
jgi:hypothetical protein